MLAVKEINRGFNFQAGFANKFGRCTSRQLLRHVAPEDRAYYLGLTWPLPTDKPLWTSHRIIYTKKNPILLLYTSDSLLFAVIFNHGNAFLAGG
jgi:hypothetical protein